MRLAKRKGVFGRSTQINTAMNTSQLSDSLAGIPDKAAGLAGDAGDFARENLVKPVRNLVHESRRQLHDAAQSVTERLGHTAEEAAAVFHDRRERTANWVSHNPFAALAAAAGAGVLLTLLIRRR